jgi:hypothetical protein
MTVTPISVKEAADLTGRTPWDIYQRTERGDLSSAMLNGVRWVAREDVLPLTVRRAS